MEKRNCDLTGRQFGRWTVLERDMENPSREDYYVCRCDCGTVRAVAEKNLVSGRSKSCGCSREKRASVDRRKDLLGKRFGKLTVVELLPEGKCRCVCDCGNEKIMNAASLKQGTQSCGCLRFKPRDDLTGKRFGRLTVISYERREGKCSAWRCKCECGKETLVARANLIEGRTRSCGCLREEKLNEIKRMRILW